MPLRGKTRDPSQKWQLGFADSGISPDRGVGLVRNDVGRLSRPIDKPSFTMRRALSARRADRKLAGGEAKPRIPRRSGNHRITVRSGMRPGGCAGIVRGIFRHPIRGAFALAGDPVARATG